MDESIGPLRVGGVAHGGWCVARLDGLAVFVAGTLPGEVVRAEVVERRSKLWFARTVEVLEASPDRVPHVWPLSESTGVGGADLGHVALPAQRAWKADVVEQQLRRMAHVDRAVTVLAAPGDDARGGLAWRTRVEFEVDGRGRLAMHAPRSDRLAPVDSMPLAHEDIQAAAPWESRWRPRERVLCLRPSEPGDSTADHARLTGGPRVLRARPGEPRDPDSPAVVFRESGDPRPAPTTHERAVVFHESGDPRPAPTIRERAAGVVYALPATSFWQVHREAAGVLAEAVLAALGDIAGRVVFDLYSGAGLFTAPLSEAGAKVWAVEGDEAAALAALGNVGRGARVVQSDVRTALQRTLPRRASAVVLDPPRAGAGRTVVEAVAARDPDRVVYVACDPASLARDVATFATWGYELTDLEAWDLFPHTHHVECVATLARRPNGGAASS
ncbi:MAG: class I SAM-dependent RNA methyltransferase [Propionibacteriaceae bacterium]|nr:class I SAM-dependent RNA methyltransferase [Propionibacteriaceae bacterium]